MARKRSRAELEAAVKQHSVALADVEARRSRLVHSRRLDMLELHLDHGLSTRAIGALCATDADPTGISGVAVGNNLRAVGLGVGESPSVPGPKARPKVDDPTPT